MANKKHPGRNRSGHQPKKYIPPKPVVPPPTEEELGEKYADMGLLRATLHIWRDSSPLTFITYLPVMALYLVYCVLWFGASVLAFFPSTLEFAVAARDMLMLGNSFVGAVGVPLLLFILHLGYNMKNKKYYFFNTLLYTVPASFLYLLLDMLNTVVAFMFDVNAGLIIREKAVVDLVVLAVAVIFTFFLGCIAQFVLSIKRQRDNPPFAGVTLPGIRQSRRK